MKVKSMHKSFENIFHPQCGNALHVYNAFMRYQVIGKRDERDSSFCLIQDLGGPQKALGGRIWPAGCSLSTPGLDYFWLLLNTTFPCT